jgi:hypothetical protein
LDSVNNFRKTNIHDTTKTSIPHFLLIFVTIRRTCISGLSECSSSTAATTTTALNAKDQKKNVVNKKSAAAPEAKEREKKDGIGLLFLYMIPWKNPNSIFVYMLLIVYGLGKYSEAHSAASSTL